MSLEEAAGPDSGTKTLGCCLFPASLSTPVLWPRGKPPHAQRQEPRGHACSEATVKTPELEAGLHTVVLRSCECLMLRFS